MIVVIGEVRVAPSAVAEAHGAVRAMVESSRAEEGCILYAFAEDLLEPGLIRISEKWESWDALAAHGKTPHMARWREALSAIDISHRDVAAYETGLEKSL